MANPLPITPAETGQLLKRGSPMSDNDYNRLITHLRMSERPCSHYRDVPHPHGTTVLPRRLNHLTEVEREHQTYSTHRSHIGNSEIQFRHPFTDILDTGHIEDIWRMPLHDTLYTFFVVRPHRRLSDAEHAQTPYSHYPGFRARMVDADNSTENPIILEIRQIITHLTTLAFPVGAYGIQRPTLAISWALDRGRRG
ncbi:hypothetical protein K523DRAFT_405959 [Schizophyllum commune Tattone D]|nr:hypothetical protein K523DRAFT_405959 [Schizophyllum commune Tattone D]